MIRVGRGPGARIGSLVLALVLGAGALSGCASARTSQGTTDESCYLALPAAKQAVGGRGQLAGVRKLTLTQLHGMAPRLYAHLAREMSAHQSVCLAAYKGRFTSSEVQHPYGGPSGTLAVAVVRTPGNRVLGTLIVTKVPVRFQHLF